MSQNGSVAGRSGSSIRGFAAMLGTVPLGCATVFVWIIMLGFLADPSLWSVAWLLLAVALTWATLALARYGLQQRQRARLPIEMRRVLAGLPPRISLKASTYGSFGPSGSQGAAFWLAIAAFVVGNGFALLLAVGVQVERDVVIVLGINAMTGLISGGLLAIARDVRGRRQTVLTAVLLPAGLATAIVVGGLDEPWSLRDVGAALPTLAWIFLVTGLPVVAGFGVIRGLIALYRATRPIDLAADPGATSLQPELEAATDHQRADAVLREYPMVGGDACLASDRVALEGAGYELRQVSQQVPGAGWRAVNLLASQGSDDESRLWALFVRRE